MNGKVSKAVIPVAGLGTRFLPATKAIPKEMIPIVDVPMIQLIVEEAVQSGIRDIVFVTARHKEAIENHFDISFELDHTLEQRQKTELLEASRSVSRLCNVLTVRQKQPLGLGHAVLTAEPLVGGEPFAVLLGDDLIDSNVPCTAQLVEIFERFEKAVVGVMEVPEREVSKYGIVGGTERSDCPGLWEASGLVEKPSVEQAPSRLAIPGRYILTPSIFAALKTLSPGKGGEIQLTDGLQVLAAAKNLLAYQFSGQRYDTGDRLGFLEATIVYALKRPELREAMQTLLKKYAQS